MGLLLLDVTPLGIETLGEFAQRLLRETQFLQRRAKFSLAADNQTSVEVHVLQGERGVAKDNKTWECSPDGILPAQRGTHNRGNF